jgi:hypothetical protein
MQYRNFASKLLLSRQWERQHVVTLEAPPLSRGVVKALARTVLRPDIRHVEIKAPIFIIGMSRCGSTMMHQLLCEHDTIVYFTNAMAPFRDPTLYRAASWMQRNIGLDVSGERYLKDSIIVNGGSPSEAVWFWAEALRMDPFDLTWPERRIADFSADQIRFVTESIRHVIACFDEVEQPRFVNKSPALLSEVLLLQELFPDARFVYMVRDGRMVANSLVKMYRLSREQDIKVNHPLFKDRPFIPFPRVPGLEEVITKWGADDIRATATIWDSSIKLMNGIRPQIRNLYEIRYEDFLADPAHRLQEIFDFCHLPEPNAQARIALDERLSKVGVLNHQNRYENYDVVEKIAGDSLKQYHYV